jgi:hypothetical protein
MTEAERLSGYYPFLPSGKWNEVKNNSINTLIERKVKMRKIDFIHLLSNLIKEYETVHGMMRFEVKRIDNTFVLIHVDQKLLDEFKVSRDFIVGKRLSELPLKEGPQKKIMAMYEKAWNGKEVVNYHTVSTNKDIIIVYTIKPRLKSGRTDKLVGYCAILDAKHFKDFEYLIN